MANVQEELQAAKIAVMNRQVAESAQGKREERARAAHPAKSSEAPTAD